MISCSLTITFLVGYSLTTIKAEFSKILGKINEGDIHAHEQRLLLLLLFSRGYAA